MSKSARVTVVMDVSVKDAAVMSAFIKAAKDALTEMSEEFKAYSFLQKFEINIRVEQETMHGKK